MCGFAEFTICQSYFDLSLKPVCISCTAVCLSVARVSFLLIEIWWPKKTGKNSVMQILKSRELTWRNKETTIRTSSRLFHSFSPVLKIVLQDGAGHCWWVWFACTVYGAIVTYSVSKRWCRGVLTRTEIIRAILGSQWASEHLPRASHFQGPHAAPCRVPCWDEIVYNTWLSYFFFNKFDQ